MNAEETLNVAIVDDVHDRHPAGTGNPEDHRRAPRIRHTGGRRCVSRRRPAAYSALPEIDCILINWNLGGDTSGKCRDTETLIHEIRERNEKIPIFLMGEPTTAPPVALTISMVRRSTSTSG